jgi:hypothetical protein
MKMHWVLPAVLWIAGCGTMELASRWRTGDLAVDAKHTEWFASGVATKDKRASAVLFNDSSYLYAGIRTTDRDLQRLILREGLTWWFDREGGSSKKFGIRYPVGAGQFMGPPPEGPGMAEPGLGPDPDALPMESNELEIYAMGDEQAQRMSKVAAGGIDAWLSRSRDTLFCVMKVPLADKGIHPFAIEIAPGAILGIGVETVMNRPREPDRSGMPEMGAGPEGGPGGRHGGGGSGMGGPPGGRPLTGARTDPLSLWGKVQLASGVRGLH